MIKSFYQKLSQREKRLILITILTVGLASLYFFFYQPIINSSQNLTSQIDDASNLYDWITQQTVTLKQLNAQNPSNLSPVNQNETLFTLIESTLRNTNIAPEASQISSNNPNTVNIQFSNISFDQLINWIATLDNDYKISVTQAIINRIDQAPGQVQASVNLTR